MREFHLRSIGIKLPHLNKHGRLFMRKLQLGQKIFLANFLIALLSLGLYGSYNYFQTITVNKAQLIETVQGKMDAISSHAESIVARVETQASSFVLSEIFKESIQNMEQKKPVEYYDAYLKLDRYCADMENLDKLYTINVYFENRYTMFNNQERFFYDNINVTSKLQGESKGWFYDQENFANSILYARKVNSGTENEVTVLFILPEKALISWGDGLLFYDDEITFIGMANRQFPSYDTDGMKSMILEQVISSGLSNGSLNMRINEREYYVLFQRGVRTPFYTISAYPTANMEIRALQSVRGMFYILLPILCVAFMISGFVSIKISKRLKHLAKVMDHMSENDFKAQIDDDTDDEISRLVQSFNYMSEKINNTMEEIRSVQKKQAMAELRMLQAQINPHFIYNTLDSVSWLAIKTDAPEISYIVRNLSEFLRMSLNMGNQESTVLKEVKHTIAYFNIQQFRFENRIRLVVDIPEEMNDIEINNLTLQPLVENAIVHGILSEEGRTGRITIYGEIVEDEAVIYVTDDGIGMTEEEVLNVYIRIEGRGMPKGSETNHGYGLYNVHQRLQHQFGNGYGVNIMSSKNEGTSCIIILPINNISAETGER